MNEFIQNVDDSRIMCLDIGGTMIKYGLGEFWDEKLLEVHSTPNRIFKFGVEAMIEQIIEIYDDYCKRGEAIDGIAIGTAGIVEEKTGKIILIGDNFPGYSGYPLGDRLRELTNLNVVVGNDVNMAAYGEYSWGAGKDSNLMAMITLGTGVGSAVIFAGHPIVGRHGATGEIGYYKLADGSKLDDVGSTRGLVNCLAGLTGEPVEELNGKIVVERVKAGDALAIQALERTCNYIAEGMVRMAKTIDPDCFVMGGGIMESADVVLPYIKKALQEQDAPEIFKDLDIRPATMGNKAGMYGAIRYYIDEMEKEDK